MLSESWVRKSWTPRTISPFSGDEYGFGWFITRMCNHTVYYARGFGGQFIHVVPTLRLTVVITSDRSARTRVGGYRGFPGTPGFLREPFGPGWALVGDASYFKDPVSAHGITDAFIGAELLADAVADTLLCGVDERLALGDYQRDRDEMAAAMMPPVVRIASLGSDMSEVTQSWKQMSAAMRDEYAMLDERERTRLAIAA